MIKLSKVEEPQILKDRGADWLKVLSDKLKNGLEPTATEKRRYAHKDIKTALLQETHGKCAYCESYFAHIAYGDVEHIIAKSSDLEETFKWGNLTLACDICNTNKSNSDFIVDPYTEDPVELFQFIGPMIFATPSNDKAVNTEKKLLLNRKELIERRSERLKGVADQILLISKVQNVELKATLREDLETNEIGDDKEFAAFVRSFISAFLPPALGVSPAS